MRLLNSQKRDKSHFSWQQCCVQHMSFLELLFLRICEIFDATCHLKKGWGFRTFLMEQNFLLDIIKTTLKYLRSYIFIIRL